MTTTEIPEPIILADGAACERTVRAITARLREIGSPWSARIIEIDAGLARFDEVDEDCPRAKRVAALRAYADLIEAKPDLPLGYCLDFVWHSVHGADKDEVLKRMREIRRAYGVPFTKRVTEGEFSSEFKLEGNYHGTRVEISTSRENVCEKVIVGEEKIEVTVPDPDLVSQVPLVTRTVTQKRHEWVCPEELGG